MKIKDINLENRPRERMIKYGVESLSNEELLAILINTGTKEKSSLEISQDILNEAGNIKNLFGMTYNELLGTSGIKMAKACVILASFELCKRAISYKGSSEIYNSSQKIYDFIYPKVAGLKTEVLYQILFDSKFHMIMAIKYASGDVAKTSFPKNKMISDAVKYGARFAVLCHNHPSGDSLPSKSDIDITINYKESLSYVDVILSDHIILGECEYYSFSDEKVI